MKKVIFRLTDGKALSFKVSEAEADKLIMTLDNVTTRWLLMENVRINPQYIASYEIRE
jgi:hypothetical protein